MWHVPCVWNTTICWWDVRRSVAELNATCSGVCQWEGLILAVAADVPPVSQCSRGASQNTVRGHIQQVALCHEGSRHPGKFNCQKPAPCSAEWIKYLTGAYMKAEQKCKTQLRVWVRLWKDRNRRSIIVRLPAAHLKVKLVYHWIIFQGKAEFSGNHRRLG